MSKKKKKKRTKIKEITISAILFLHFFFFKRGFLLNILGKATKFNNAAEEPLTSAIRGLDFLFHATCEKDAFDAFGADSIQFFHDIATFSVEPTRDRSLRYAEQLAQWWKTRTILTNLENCEETVCTSFEKERRSKLE